MLIRIINIILLMVIFCYGQSKVKWRDLAPQTQQTISDLAADSARAAIEDSIIIAAINWQNDIKDSIAFLRIDTQTNITNQANNLIIDYSFEIMGPTVIGWASYTAAVNDFWEWRRGASDKNIVFNDPDNALHGNYVAKIDTNTNDIHYQLYVGVDSLTQYTFSYYRKATVVDSGDITWSLSWRDTAGAQISVSTFTYDINISEAWTKHDTTVTSPSGAVYTQINLTSEDDDWSDATLYLDFISLIAAASTPDYVNTKDDPVRTMDNKENWYHVENLEVENISINGTFRFYLDTSYSTYRYGNPFTIYNYNNDEVFWFDDAGNLWSDANIQRVTRGTSGVSAGHILHSVGWEQWSFGTTNGLVFLMNDLNSVVKKLTFWQGNQIDTTHTFIPGKIMLGGESLITIAAGDDAIGGRDSLDTISNVIIDHDSTVIRNVIKYDYTAGLPDYPQRNEFIFLNDYPVDIDTIAVYNGYVWKYFISDSGAYNTEATALFARMTTQPSDDRKETMNFLIEGLKNFQIWQKLDVLYVFANDTVDGGEKLFLNWVSSSFNATNNGMTIQPDTGITSDGSSSYMNTNWTPADSNNYTLNDACMFIYSRIDSAYNKWDFGASDSTYWLGMRVNRENYNIYYHLNILEWASVKDLGDSTSLGLFSMNHVDGETRGYVFHNGTRVGSGYDHSLSTKGVPSAPYNSLYVGALQQKDIVTFPTNRQYSVFGIGGGLNDKQQSKLFKLIEYYLDALGSGVVN